MFVVAAVAVAVAAAAAVAVLVVVVVVQRPLGGHKPIKLIVKSLERECLG